MTRLILLLTLLASTFGWAQNTPTLGNLPDNGPVLPATCSPPQMYFQTITGATPVGVYQCLSANVWSQIGSSAAGSQLSVTTFGAVGNGSTNDGAAIQAAITAAQTAGKGTVTFPCGSYEIGSTALRVSADGIGLIGSSGSPTIKTSAVPCVELKSSSTVSASAPPALTNPSLTGNCAANDFGIIRTDTTGGSLSNGTFQIGISYLDPYTAATAESPLSTPLSVTLAGGTATQTIHVCSPDYNGKPKFYRTYVQSGGAPTTANLDNTTNSCIGSSTPHTPPCWIGDQQDITVVGAGTGNFGTGIGNAPCMLTIENASGPGTQLKVGPEIRNINFHTSSSGSGCMIHNISASATKLENVSGVGGSSGTPGLTGFWNGGWIISSAFSDRVALDTVHMTSPWIAFFEQPQGDMDIRSADVNLPTGTGSCVAGSGVSQDTCPNGLLIVGGRVDFHGHMDIGAVTVNTGITADANAGFGTAKPVLLGTVTIEHGIGGQTAVVYKNDTNNVLTLVCTITAGTCVNADATSTGNITIIAKATSSVTSFVDSTSPMQNIWIDPSSNQVVAGNVSVGGHLIQTATSRTAGSCAMAAGTTCTFSIGAAFTGTPLCFASIDPASTVPATANSAKCSLSGTTVTVTAGISNSLTWDALLVGNPN